jgi:hypothetical protein
MYMYSTNIKKENTMKNYKVYLVVCILGAIFSFGIVMHNRSS